jgi:hypothetical protein
MVENLMPMYGDKLPSCVLAHEAAEIATNETRPRWFRRLATQEVLHAADL